MKAIRFKYLGILCLVIGLSIQSFAQNFVVVQTRKVAQEDISEFVHREETYWKAVAQKAIDDGKLSGWSIWQRVDGFDLHDDYNFIFVNEYTPEQFAMEGSIWDYKKVFPKMKREDVDTFGMSEVQDLLFFRNIYSVVKSQPNYIRVNYADAPDLGAYASMEPRIWGPFISKQMDAGKTKVVSWGFSTLTMPRGRDVPYNAVSVDGFATLADAFSGGGFERSELPEEIDELFELHQKAEIHLYRLVATTGPKKE